MVTSLLIGCDGTGVGIPPGSGGSFGGPGPAGGSGGAAAAAACDCSVVESATVKQPLTCVCPLGSMNEMCATNLAALDPLTWCGSSLVSVFRETGCGKISFVLSGLSGGSRTFDAQSGELIGVTEFSDIPWGTCMASGAYGYSYGDGLDAEGCPTLKVCKLCGDIDRNGVGTC